MNTTDHDASNSTMQTEAKPGLAYVKPTLIVLAVNQATRSGTAVVGPETTTGVGPS